MALNPIYQARPRVAVPSYSRSNYSQSEMTNYLQTLTEQGSNFSSVNSYTNGATITTDAYFGGVYSPTQNRIYFVPNNQAATANVSWHYIDCNTGTVVAYANPGNTTPGTTAATAAYSGGVYSPTQNRIYFVPREQANTTFTLWHYIDCNVDSGATMVGTYASPGVGTVSGAYIGGVYSPTQNRIYFVPFAQGLPNSGTTTNWHYIDCNNGTVGTYLNPNNAVANAYWGGAYSPTQNRIYFSPAAQGLPNSGTTTNWHYIDCNNGTVGTYLNPNNAVSSAYNGASYSPTQNRIYFIPNVQGASTNPLWHYIDCNTGLVGTYPNSGNVVSGGYQGSIYSPTQNRIYFSPRAQSDPSNTLWHYIDCNTGLVGTYLNPLNAVNLAYVGGVYSPTQNRIYFVPRNQTGTLWNFLDMQSNATTSKVLMAGTEYNKL